MPSNEQRRASAKRKLERQLERRAQQARRRRTLAIVGGSVAAVVVVAAIVATVVLTRHDDKKSSASGDTSTSAAPGAAGAPLPAFKPPAEATANCQYPPASAPASKPTTPPEHLQAPREAAPVSVSMVTNQGRIGLLLNAQESPCTVNSFGNLARQKFFDGTKCHRLTTSPSLGVLQCGDPSGDGTGGPGYQFANEYPTDQYPPGAPALQQPVVYPRGTIAMANSGPNTNGSQFFLVYKDSQLPPNYTVFGKIQQDGLATLDKIAKAGIAGGGEDGPPASEVTIKSVAVD